MRERWSRREKRRSWSDKTERYRGADTVIHSRREAAQMCKRKNRTVVFDRDLW